MIWRMAAVRAPTGDVLEAVHAVLAARSRAAFGTSDTTVDHIRSAWKVPSFDLGRDAWVAATDGRLTGYAAVDDTGDLTHAAADAAVGDYLLARAESRARERGLGRLAVTAVPEDVPLHELVRRSGFELDREIWRMWRTLADEEPEPAWPDGTTVRTYTAADGQRVHELLDDAYAGWDDDYVRRDHPDWLQFMTGHDDFDPELWFLIERDGDLVAAALHWKEFRGDGWVKDIVVRESEQGRGLARALLQHAFRAYRSRGAQRVGLKVDANNPTGAAQLYERVGFVTDRRYGIWTKAL